LKPLYGLLDGQSDSQSATDKNDHENEIWRKTTRYMNNSTNRPVFQIKLQGLRIIEIIFNYSFTKLLTKFFSDFKALQATTSRAGEGD